MSAQNGAVTKPRWTEDVEPYLREQAYRAIQSDPEFLFEHDGGPYGVTADLIYARLIGFEEEIVHDGWRLPRIEPNLRLPVISPLRVTEDLLPPRMRTADYVLQSGYATQRVDVQTAPDVLDLLPATPADFMITVLYLRYKRRR